MKVVFLLRGDALAKPGGDSTKVFRYQKELTRFGHEVQIVTKRTDLPERADIVHLVNLDLPAENTANAAAARKTGARVVLSTIRHPNAGIRAMYEFGQDTFYDQTRHLGISPGRAITTREMLKLVARRDPAAKHALKTYESAQNRLLNSVDMLLPMAESEASAIRDDFQYRGPSITIPNALSLSTAKAAPADKKFDVVTLGRIEPRKNSLELAVAAHENKIRTGFAGRINVNHGRYSESFLELASSSPYVSYCGDLAHERVPDFLLSGHTYVNPAWFEVVSQADFEAINLGVPVVTTAFSYLKDFVEDVPTFDPTDIARSPSSLPGIVALAARCKPPATRSWGGRR